MIWLSQTTLSVDETMETVHRLRVRFPKLQDPPSDDICYATQNRQVAVKQLAADCDVVIVVGSRNSSNSVRLVEVALEHGAGAAHLVDFADEIDEIWLVGVERVGVTSAPRCQRIGGRRARLPRRARLCGGDGGPRRRGVARSRAPPRKRARTYAPNSLTIQRSASYRALEENAVTGAACLCHPRADREQRHGVTEHQAGGVVHQPRRKTF